MKIQAIALAVTTSLFAFDSLAAELVGKSYLVGSVGSAKMDLGDAEDYYKSEADYYNSIPGVSASAKTDDKSTSYSLGAGHWLNENVAIEGFYRNYGEVSASIKASDGVDYLNEKSEFSAAGLGVGILGALPLSDSFSLYGRLDLVNLKTEVEYSYNDSWGFSEGNKEDDTNIKVGLGVGAQFTLNNNFAIRADFQRIEGELEDFKEDIDSFNLSVLALF